MLPYADHNDVDILYHSKLREIDEDSVYLAITDSEEEYSSSSNDEERQISCFEGIHLNMHTIKKEEGESSKHKIPYSKFEDQTFRWKSNKWSLKKWKFREDPPPDEIAFEFFAMTSEEKHLCEECGYSTSTGQKEEDIFFESKKYNLHFHKTCFLAVLQDNRGQRAMKVVLDHLGQFWKDIEERRLLQYLQQRKIAQTTL